jgi:hypothetical protein
LHHHRSVILSERSKSKACPERSRRGPAVAFALRRINSIGLWREQQLWIRRETNTSLFPTLFCKKREKDGARERRALMPDGFWREQQFKQPDYA